MNKFKAVVAAGVCVLSLAGAALAQDRWNVEVRGNGNFPVAKLGATELSPGAGFEFTASYRFLPHLSVYAGWGWNRFRAEESFAGEDADFEETGYSLGLKFRHPIGDSRFQYVLSAGGLFNHLEVENEEGDLVADSNHEPGLQIGAGIAIPVGNRFMITPDVRYRYLPGDLKGDAISDLVHLNYVSAGVAVSVGF